MRVAKIVTGALIALAATVALPGPSALAATAPPTTSPGIEMTWGQPAAPGSRAVTDDGYCKWTFADIKKVNNFLEWGAETLCGGTGFIPHSVTIILEQRHYGVYWEELKRVTSPYAWNNLPDISLYQHNDQCEYGTTVKLRMNAHEQAGSHGRDLLSDEFSVPCKIAQ